jgi:hypothetical protein
MCFLAAELAGGFHPGWSVSLDEYSNMVVELKQ